MTTNIRKPISADKNNWHDGQNVHEEDMSLEQSSQEIIAGSTISNHFGDGVLRKAPTQPVLFDSDNLSAANLAILSANNFDGTGLQVDAQPSDSNFGCQLEVELTNSLVFGRTGIKVLIIGTDFNGDIQYDRFYFYKNEKQVTSKHYTKILCVFFNDFKGNNLCSITNGGIITIKEAKSLQISKDNVMISQDIQPNLFFRDFKLAHFTKPTFLESLLDTLQTGMGSANLVGDLNVQVVQKNTRKIVENDVTTKYAQKFIAKSNNLQKVTLLLGADISNNSDITKKYDWSGDIVISIYPLFRSVNCAEEIVPSLKIEFDPDITPLAQLSFSQATLKSKLGIVLTDALQPVDFVFSSSQIANPSSGKILKDEYYAVTINRSGSANNGKIFIGTGNHYTENSRMSIFSGTWSDVTDEDLWFQVWCDSIKISDGQAYESGNGSEYEKTIVDQTTGAVIDNQVKLIDFTNTGSNTTNYCVFESVVSQFDQVQDERTGDPVNKKQKFVPAINLVTSSELSALVDPLVIGAAVDYNSKNDLYSDITKNQEYPYLVNGNSFIVVNPDPDLLSRNLIGSLLYPNSSGSSAYKIFKSVLCHDGYGDVNGDGDIDASDLSRMATLVGESLFYQSTWTKIYNGQISTLELIRADVDGDGYVTSADLTLLTNYINKSINAFPAGSYFRHLELTVQSDTGRYDGYYNCGDGYVRIDGYDASEILIDHTTLTPSELIYYGYNSVITMESDAVLKPNPSTNFGLLYSYKISPVQFWVDYLISVEAKAKESEVCYSYNSEETSYTCNRPSTYSCTNLIDNKPTVNVGRNDKYIPGNIFIKNRILDESGNDYKIDFETAIINIELPQQANSKSSGILNIFEKFVYDRGDGLTNAGFAALRFYDCSTVKSDALVKNQIRFGVSVESIYSDVSNSDAILNAHIDQSTGILTVDIKNTIVDSLNSLMPRLQITVYLKKAGFNNGVLTITSSQFNNLKS